MELCYVLLSIMVIGVLVCYTSSAKLDIKSLQAQVNELRKDKHKEAFERYARLHGYWLNVDLIGDREVQFSGFDRTGEILYITEVYEKLENIDRFCECPEIKVKVKGNKK